LTQPVQWVCAKCGAILGDEQSECAVRELREENAILTELARNWGNTIAVARGEIATFRARAEGAERSAIALEKIASAFRENEAKLLAEIDELKKHQMPFGV
jgi:hypothetical protein